MKNFITRFFPKWFENRTIKPIDRQIDDTERTINSETTDLKAMLPKKHQFRSNASVFEIYESSTSGMINHMFHLKGELDSKTVLLNQYFARYTELVLPHNKTQFLGLEEERRFQEAKLNTQKFYIKNQADFEKGILAEEAVMDSQIRSNKLKGTIIQSELQLLHTQNQTLPTRLQNNFVNQTLNQSENNALDAMKFVEKNAEVLNGNQAIEKVLDPTKESEINKNLDTNNTISPPTDTYTFSEEFQHNGAKIMEQKSSNFIDHGQNAIMEDTTTNKEFVDTYLIPNTIYPEPRKYSTNPPIFTEPYGLPYDYVLISQQHEKQLEFAERFAESRIPPYPNTDIEMEIPKNMASRLTPIKEFFLLANVKRYEIILCFLLLIFGLAVEYNAMGSVLTNIFYFSGWKSIIAGSTILILSKLLAYLLSGSVKEFFSREAKILNWKGIKVNKLMVFVIVAIFCYSLSVGYLFSKSTDRNRKVQEVSILQTSVQNAKDQAEFSDVTNHENKKSIQEQETQLEIKQKELENNEMDILTITAISLSGFLILLASALLFAIVGLLLSAYSLRRKIEKLNHEIHSIYSEFSAQKASIHQIYLKSGRIIKLYGILEFLKKQKDYNIDQKQRLYCTDRKGDPVNGNENSNVYSKQYPLPLDDTSFSEKLSQNGAYKHS